MEFDPKNANAPMQPQMNRHQMRAIEVKHVGTLLSNLGKTLISAAGRLDRHDDKNHSYFTKEYIEGGIEARSPSALNDAMESLCLHTWNIRNQINAKVGVTGKTLVGDIDAWTEEIAVLSNAKQTTSDKHLAEALGTSIAALRQRIDDAQNKSVVGDVDDYFKASERLDVKPATLDEEDDIDVLMNFYGDETEEQLEVFGDVGKPELQTAIKRLKRGGITHIYQLLNTPKSDILALAQNANDDAGTVLTSEVLIEVLHSYGFKWRTGGKNTRFDLPVGRFGFSREAYRTRSERRAATAFVNAAKGKKSGELGVQLREWVEFILVNAHEVAAITYKDNTITSSLLVEKWFDAVDCITEKFKGVIPERLWMLNISLTPTSRQESKRCVGLPSTSTNFRSKFGDAIRAMAEREIEYRQVVGPGNYLTSSFNNNDISENFYLPINVFDEYQNVPANQSNPLGHHYFQLGKMNLGGTDMTVHTLVHVITEIIFGWIKSTEKNAMQDAATLEALNGEYVWNTALSQYGWMPFAWRTKNLVPHEMDEDDHFALMGPIELGQKLEYKNVN